MQFRVPVYVHATKSAGGAYVARPLFFPAPAPPGRQPEPPARQAGPRRRKTTCTPSPASPGTTNSPSGRSAPGRRNSGSTSTSSCAGGRPGAGSSSSSFDHLGRRLAFTPARARIVVRGRPRRTRSTDRAAVVLTEHWRAAERDADDEADVRPGGRRAGRQGVGAGRSICRCGRRRRRPRPPKSRFLALGGGGPADGATELRRVGRCLDWLYPDELDRAVLRDAEASELARLLDAPDRRPVLLVGPRMVGKTAVVHEVRPPARGRAQGAVHRAKRNVWLLSPQRLISGMSLRRPVGGPAARHPQARPASATTSSTSTTCRGCSWPGCRPTPTLTRGGRAEAVPGAAGRAGAGRDHAGGAAGPAGAGPRASPTCSTSCRCASRPTPTRLPRPGRRAAAARRQAPLPVRAGRPAGGDRPAAPVRPRRPRSPARRPRILGRLAVRAATRDKPSRAADRSTRSPAGHSRPGRRARRRSPPGAGCRSTSSTRTAARPGRRAGRAAPSKWSARPDAVRTAWPTW